MSKHSKDLCLKAKQLALKGVSRSKIAKQLGVSYNTVKTWLVGFDTRGKAKPDFNYQVIYCNNHVWTTLLWA